MRKVRCAVAAILVTALWPAAAGAACSSAWVLFTDVAPSAATVVIGTVTNAVTNEAHGDGYASVFRVNVEEVLRGPDEPVVEVHQAINSRACLSVVVARNGDRIALARGGSAHGEDDLTSLAYLSGEPYRSEVEMMTRAEVYAAAGVDLPDTAVAQSHEPALLGWLLIGLAIIVPGLGRRRHRRDATHPPGP